MLKFYWGLFRGIPEVLRGTTEAWIFWIQTIVVPVVVALYPKWKVYVDGPTFSRWVIVFPIVLSIIYGMLRVNYVRYTELANELKAAKQRESERADNKAIRDELGELLGTFNFLRADITTGKPIAIIQADLKVATEKLKACVERSLDRGEVALLTPGKNMKPDGFIQMMNAAGDIPRMTSYVLATHYVEAVQRLLTDVVPTSR